MVAVEPQIECGEVLRTVFGDDSRFTLIPTALGDAPGEAEMLMTSASTIASLSPKWVNAVKESGRFSEFDWNKKQKVPITTLDLVIARHGTPAFLKIDVEGFEYPVLKGLSKPVRTISFEFTPEFSAESIKCVEHLHTLGRAEFNYSLGESISIEEVRYFGLSASTSPRILTTAGKPEKVAGHPANPGQAFAKTPAWRYKTAHPPAPGFSP